MAKETETKTKTTKKVQRPETATFEEPKIKAGTKPVKAKAKKKGKRKYEQLPERELRRQLKRIERRATKRVVMISLGLLSVGLSLLASYTLSIISLFAALFGLYGVIYSLFAFIRIKEVKWYFIVIGLAINIAGLALSISPSIAFFLHVLDNLDAISSIF